MKTTFSSGVIVTSQWLNGAQQISFDGQDLDWHYPALGLESINTSGPNGLDSYYVTLGTDQPILEPVTLPDFSKSFKLVSGKNISGTKVVTGLFHFGFDQNPVLNNPGNISENAPRSYTTNQKYNYAGGVPNPTIAQKFRSLDNSDLVTKQVLSDVVFETVDLLTIDNGYYYVDSGTCNNYSTPDIPPSTGNSNTVCEP